MRKKEKKKDKLEVAEDKNRIRRNSLDSQSIIGNDKSSSASLASPLPVLGCTSFDDRSTRKPGKSLSTGASAGELHSNISIEVSASPTPAQSLTSSLGFHPSTDEFTSLVGKRNLVKPRAGKEKHDPVVEEREKMLQLIARLQNEALMLKAALADAERAPPTPTLSVREMNAAQLAVHRLLLESQSAYLKTEMDNLQKCLNSTIPKVSNDELKELLLLSASEAKLKKKN